MLPEFLNGNYYDALRTALTDGCVRPDVTFGLPIIIAELRISECYFAFVSQAHRQLDQYVLSVCELAAESYRLSPHPVYFDAKRDRKST